MKRSEVVAAEPVPSVPKDPDEFLPRLVERVLTIDVEAAYERHEKAIKRDPARTEYGVIYAYVDETSDICREIHRAYLAAKGDLAKYERECEVVMAALRGEAQRELEAEKRAGAKTGVVTKDDIRARMLEKHPDEVLGQEDKLLRMKLVVEHLEELPRIWRGRCEDARAMLNSLRKGA